MRKKHGSAQSARSFSPVLRVFRRNASLFSLLLLLIVSLVQGASVRSDRWLADVKYLSSDALKGRGDGTPELDEAAAYIADQFQKAGLEPLAGSYFQPFEAVITADLGQKNSLALEGPASRSYQLRRDFIPLSLSETGEQTVQAAFVGYGITAPEYSYDDYANVDVRGKAVIVLRHEPQENDANSKFLGRQLTRHATFVNKAINARNHGAVAVLIVNDPLNHSGDKLVPFGQTEGPGTLGILVLQVTQSVIDQWLNSAGKSLADLQRAIDGNLSNQSFLLPSSIQLKIQTEINQQRSTLKNVAGYLRGSDPAMRDEVIVIGAHYDHLGLGEYGGSMAPSQIGQIHHGADDNASGTAGIMELARSLQADQYRPRRSLLFMAFAGEELGLLGSAYYVKAPLLPLDRTIAMVNLDMIGRMKNKKLYIGGVGTSPGFRQLVEAENKDGGLSIDFSDSENDASDHMSFGRNQVPVLFFFSGLHSDYHKPSDTWDKVEPEETAHLLELVQRVIVTIDSEQERPPFTAPRGGRSAVASSTGGPSSGYGPYFGSVPDFGETTKGVKFADVREDSPAAKAGLKPDDILVKFGDQEIQNLYDFTYALQSKKPGDEVRVVVLRGGQKVEAVVKLATRE